MVVPHNIPAALTSLIGRDRELSEIRRLLTETRYVTLTGLGGAGKTRLAREVAATAAGIGAGHRGCAAEPPLAGGVWWIELAPLAPGADVTATVAVALGVGAPAGDALADAVADAIGARRTMLVLDNCEHVVESCAPLVDLLLRACPALIVVATSREALGGDGETVWQLPGLSHPALAPGQPRFDPRTEPRPVVDGAELSILEGYESVRLFVSRARAASPRFVLTTHNAGAVRAICARLDGLPLALELAAANVGVLGVEQIAARLDDAFAVLTRGRRTALPRHRTLGALLDWSHDLLSDDERRLLARLSVFRAAVPLEAIEAVGGADAIDDVLGAFSGLVDHSLVDVGESEGEPRYRLLETVRQYAAARLRAVPDDERATRGRHARWMAGLADVMGEETGSPRRGRAMARLHPQVEDARAALEWSTGAAGDPRDALRIAGGLAIFWHWAGLWVEGLRWAEAALRVADAAAVERGERDDAARPLDERVPLAKALQTALLLAWMLGDPATTIAHADRALPLWRGVAGDPGADASERARAAQWEAYTHEILAFARLALGDVAAAERAIESAVAAADRSGSGWARGLALGWRAMLATAVGRPADATRDLARAESELRAVGDSWVLSWCYANGATAALAQGDPVTAARQARAGVAALKAEPDWHYVSRALDALAESGAAWLASPAGVSHPSAEREAMAGASATLLGAAAGVRERSGTAVWPFDRAAHAAALSWVRDALGATVFDARWEEGRSLSLEAVFALAATAHVVPDEVAGGGASPAHAEAAGDARIASESAARRAETTERATTTLRIRVLGPLLVVRDGLEVPLEAWRSAKARELLLYLVLHGPRSREQIGLALWPDASDAQVRNAFHVTLHAIRRALGGRDWVVFDGSAYGLRRAGTSADGPSAEPAPARLEVDVDELLGASASAQRAARRQDAVDGEQLSAWRAALGGAAGELGEGLPSGDWLVEHQDRVRTARADGLSALGRLYAARGAHGDAAAVYRVLVARDPLQETTHRELMRAYAAAGEPARAVQHFDALAALLARELRASPARETAALAAEIRGALART